MDQSLNMKLMTVGSLNVFYVYLPHHKKVNVLLIFINLLHIFSTFLRRLWSVIPAGNLTCSGPGNIGESSQQTGKKESHGQPAEHSDRKQPAEMLM